MLARTLERKLAGGSTIALSPVKTARWKSGSPISSIHWRNWRLLSFLLHEAFADRESVRFHEAGILESAFAAAGQAEILPALYGP